MAKKEGATDISRVLGDGPGVNFALVSSVNHNGCLLHTVSVRLEKARQKEMWEWLLERERGQLLARGLMAVILQSGTFLWMRGKPTSCKLPTCTYKKNNRNCHYRSPPPLPYLCNFLHVFLSHNFYGAINRFEVCMVEYVRNNASICIMT